MKKVDFRSMLIGMLLMVIAFMFMGQTSGVKYFDSIVVSEMILVGDDKESTTIVPRGLTCVTESYANNLTCSSAISLNLSLL